MTTKTLLLIALFSLLPMRCVSGETQQNTEQDQLSAAPQPDPTPLMVPDGSSGRPDLKSPGTTPDAAVQTNTHGGPAGMDVLGQGEVAATEERKAKQVEPEKNPDKVFFRRLQHADAVEIDEPDKIPEGQLRIQTDDGKILALPLAHTSVEAEVSGLIGRVWVTQYFTNPYDHPIEAVYVFPLPQESAVDDMEMHIGERVVRGIMKERGEAKRIYEAAKKAGKTASLLEQERPNIFTQSIANILPGDNIKIRIRYVENLKYEDGGYEFVFPMVVGPRYIPGQPQGKSGGGFANDTNTVPDASRITPPVLKKGERSGHDIDVTLTIDSGVSIKKLESPSHEIVVTNESNDRTRVTLKPFDTLPNKDFVVRYQTAGEDLEVATLFHSSDLGSYFMLLFQPEATPEADNIAPRELVFVVDCSGSMSGTPLAKAKQAMAKALKSMRPDDYFQVIKFSDHARGFSSKPVKNTPENLKRALQYVDQMRGTGGTQMIEGIKAALDYPEDPSRIRIVAFMTDGYIGNDTQIIAAVKQKIQSNTRLFSFGIGSSVNRFLLDRMAEAGRGYVTYVRQDESPNAAVERFYRRIQTPVLVNIAVEADGGAELEEVFPAAIPDLFAGQPLVVHGKYKGDGPTTITITGRRGTKEFKKTLKVRFPKEDERNGVLGTLWARQKIKYFMSKMYGHQDPDIKAKVIELAIQFRIMSQFTSFVAVEEKIRNDGGKQETVQVPVEMAEGVSHEGVFGEQPKAVGYGPGAPMKATRRVKYRVGNARGRGMAGGGIVASEEAMPLADTSASIIKKEDKKAPRGQAETEKDSDDRALSAHLSSIVVLSGPTSESTLTRMLKKLWSKISKAIRTEMKSVGSAGTVRLVVMGEVSKSGTITVKSVNAASGNAAVQGAVTRGLTKALKKVKLPGKDAPTQFKFSMELR